MTKDTTSHHQFATSSSSSRLLRPPARGAGDAGAPRSTNSLRQLLREPGTYYSSRSLVRGPGRGPLFLLSPSSPRRVGGGERRHSDSSDSHRDPRNADFLMLMIDQALEVMEHAPPLRTSFGQDNDPTRLDALDEETENDGDEEFFVTEREDEQRNSEDPRSNLSSSEREEKDVVNEKRKQ
mmetsp:Transcript_30998/g.64687  ORF Transcript_30998/g.64687 Transcript_30998/m.64687 type:complete len:181 (-) Transcript_30998:241-783(-)|eukprot:CAMPEP_0172472336 /NCGR_PEP_ID=MMETSP1065-20121228/68281_1 /TAXON_ID=265537 /ORGANISM="Amphiprora paludosa, Strain CCMP125" /LENGTH=180 /DNA_ID=CAMNT_0013230467 /DNA_START=154 /DNA_END=696 /DNA_ORIENTATION=+